MALLFYGYIVKDLASFVTYNMLNSSQISSTSDFSLLFSDFFF